MEFTENEIKAMQERPEILRELAEYHEVQATMTDGIDFTECIPFHESRRDMLRKEADRIEAEY